MLNNIIVNPFTLTSGILLFLGLIFLCFTAFFSGAEVAYFSLDQRTIDDFDESEEKCDKAAVRLLGNPQKLLATILISNSLTNIAVIVLLVNFTATVFDFSFAPGLGFLIQVAVIGFLILIFGEIMPKVFSSEYAKITVQRSSRILLNLQNFFNPFVELFANSRALVNSKLTSRNYNNISMEELTQAFDITAETPVEDKEILEGIIKFGNIQVADIMTSRVDIVDVDIKMNYTQLLNLIIKSGYSRMPIYLGTRDNIKGILFSKDLLPHLDKPSTFRWQTLIRPPYYVPETKKIDDLLNEFQENRVHLAIVVDEYGGTSGLVTLEDILEEIVGDISDEYDDEETLYTKIDNHTFLFEAKILLNDFFKIAEISKEDFVKKTEDVETLAGLILELKGEMPVKNERIGYGRYVFEITSVDNRRIKKVKLHIKSNP
ncbi:MAG TPA: gliding motility-associated protein GldE [Paludibacteraceae bacterium]|nr:gliding motility-associated protein GldE [Paludibacteraceae bacterium]HPT43295.1 gliding motility-associated protein GldE [Paludibacteraceae bacterium]